MKKILFVLTLVSFSFIGFSQSNLVSISGGWAFANVDDSEYFSEDPNIKGSGWRINGTYDFNSDGGPLAYGISIGYISVTANYDGDTASADYKISSLPFYFAPKYLFGGDRARGFVKLAIGGQSANFERTGSAGTVTGNDFGFYGGGGAGVMVFGHDMVFLNAEYEVGYMTNSYYRNGLMQSVMLGVGLRL